MRNVVYTAIYIMSNIFVMFVIKNFMEVFFAERKGKVLFVLAYVSYPVLVTSVCFLFKTPIANVAANILSLMLITLVYSSSAKKKLMAVFFTYVFMVISELIMLGIAGHTDLTPLFEKGLYGTAMNVVSMTILMFLLSILAKNFKNLKNNVSVSPIIWVSSFLIPLSSIYLAIALFSSGKINQVAAIVSILIIFFINIMSFYLHDSLSAAYNDKLQTALFKQEKEYYQSQCEIMQTTNENLRSCRHDMKNHLILLSEFAEADNCSKIKEYLSELIGKLEYDGIYSATGNIAFDSIINFKLNAAKETGAEIEADVAVPKSLKMNISDVSIIIGNLIDNAVTAVSIADKKRITLKIKYDKGRLLALVENTYNGHVQYENGVIATTNEDKENHGFGLKNVSKAVDKYNGVVSLFHTDDIFKVNILLYAQYS